MAKRPRISIAADHAGYSLKKYIAACLRESGYDVIDRGARSQKRSVDYPDYSARVVHDILDNRADRGILVCGTGIGLSIGANRFERIRAAMVHDVTTAAAAARHNHANILCIGARITAPHLARQLVQIWLDAPFENRHKKRIKLIEHHARLKNS